MQVLICNNAHTYVWGQHIPFNAWYGQDALSWWFCTAHGKSDDASLELYRFNGVRWVKMREQSTTTKSICQWAEVRGLWWTKVHWFKEEDKQKSLVAKQHKHIKNIQNMMKHDRKHKSGGSGIRLDKENFYADKTITDYECSKRPLNDFPKAYN